MKFKYITTATTLLLTLALFSTATAQRMWIENVEANVNERNVAVNFYVDIAANDSINAIQTGIVWDTTKILMDTFIFAPHIVENDQLIIIKNTVSKEELKVCVGKSSIGPADPFAHDSLLFTIYFSLVKGFEGIAEINFSSRWRNMFIDYYIDPSDPELTPGSIYTSTTTATYSTGKDQAALRVIPNPTTHNFQVVTDLPGFHNAPYLLTDATGRQLDSGALDGSNGNIPRHLPNGMYFLTVRAGGEQLTARLVVRR